MAASSASAVHCSSGARKAPPALSAQPSANSSTRSQRARSGTMTPSSTIAAANTPMPHSASSTGLTVPAGMPVMLP